MQVPASLITTSWNLMKLNKDQQPANQIPPSSMAPPKGFVPTNQNSSSTEGSGQQVYMQHMKLQDKLLKVRIDPSISADGLSVENDYSKEVGNIEMDRYRALHSCPSNEVKDTINAYYDKLRLKLVDTTESSLDKLIVKAEDMRKAVMKSNTLKTENQPGPLTQGMQLSQTVPKHAQGASLLLQPADDKDKINAVRKLKFNTSEENVEDNDYLNCSVNSEDFEIDEIDVETIENKSDTPRIDSNSVTTNETDILRQCIQESGIDTLNQSIPPVTNRDITETSLDNSQTSSIATNQSTLPDSTSSASDSPISISSAEELTNHNLSSESSFNITESFTTKSGPAVSPIETQESTRRQMFPSAGLNFNAQLFSTPTPQQEFRFTDPETLNQALSEIQKLCGGPTVNFTPELRKDIHQTMSPETFKASPLNEISNASHPMTNWSSKPLPGFHSNLSKNRNISHEATSEQKLQSQQEYQHKTHQYHHHHHQQLQQQQQRPEKLSADLKNNNIQLNSTKGDCEAISSSTSKENLKTEDFKFENTPVFRTHRMLTPESTETLNRWYAANVQYPYPNDDQVDQLSQLTGITARQVKKWMANKRVRCFNTLSITGNQHPIKYKYQGQGRKRKAEAMEKENCDSTTGEKRPNYTMLSDEAKSILNQWYMNHINNPYPSDTEKQELANRCNISLSQVKSWFANKRNRSNNTKRQVPNYFIHKYPEYSHIVHMVGQKREEERMLKRRRMNEIMYIQPPFYI